MQIFLSYASEDKNVAELIAFSLRGRGYDVFLDRDDLPAGGEYDQRIEEAVAVSDLFLFLISTFSVANGRFTLTELEFARRKWRKADGHVLPVMVAPTPMEQVPSFLKAVSILEPKGNIAAEVASAVGPMVTIRDRRTYFVLGVLALASGLLTDPLFRFLGPFIGEHRVHLVSLDLLLSGLAFGFSLLLGLAFLMRFRAQMLVIPFVVLVAFFAALETWSIGSGLEDRPRMGSTQDELRNICGSRMDRSDEVLRLACETLVESDVQRRKLANFESLPLGMLIYGLAGAVGALLTYLGTAIAVEREIRASGVLIVLAVGSIAAAAYYACAALLAPGNGTYGFSPLFATWQPLVGATIGRLVK